MRHLALLSAMGALLASCTSAPEPQTTGIRLGMTQDQLAQEWGSPDRVHPAVVNQHGQTEVVVEYTRERRPPSSGTQVAKEVLKSGSSTFFSDPTEKQRYVFHFVDDRLARWQQEVTAAKPMTEPARKPAKKPTKDPAEDQTKDPSKDPSKDPMKDPAKDPTKK